MSGITCFCQDNVHTWHAVLMAWMSYCIVSTCVLLLSLMYIHGMQCWWRGCRTVLFQHAFSCWVSLVTACYNEQPIIILVILFIIAIILIHHTCYFLYKYAYMHIVILKYILDITTHSLVILFFSQSCTYI